MKGMKIPVKLLWKMTSSYYWSSVVFDKNLLKYGKIICKMIYNSKNKVPINDTINDTINLTKNEQRILNLIINNNKTTREELVNATELSDRII